MASATTRRLLLVLVLLLVGGAAGYLLRGSGTGNATQPAWSEEERLVFAISTILIPVEKGTRASLSLDTARRVYDELAAGADFGTVAKRVSQDTLASDGGYMGFLQQGGDTKLAGAAEALRPGQISLPFRMQRGYVIVKRHGLAEARALERRYRIPAHGVFVTWSALPGGRKDVTREQAVKEAEKLVADLRAKRVTLDQAMQIHTTPERRRAGAFMAMLSNRGPTAKAYQALAAVEPGTVVGPLEEPGQGFAVLVRGRPFRALVKHILIKHIGSEQRHIGITRTRNEALELAQQVLDDIREDTSRWMSGVERFSDDEGSIPNGGSLGVVYSGELPPGLDTAIHDVAPGTIHAKPIESPLGVHIVWRVN